MWTSRNRGLSGGVNSYGAPFLIPWGLGPSFSPSHHAYIKLLLLDEMAPSFSKLPRAVFISALTFFLASRGAGPFLLLDAFTELSSWIPDGPLCACRSGGLHRYRHFLGRIIDGMRPSIDSRRKLADFARAQGA